MPAVLAVPHVVRRRNFPQFCGASHAALQLTSL